MTQKILFICKQRNDKYGISFGLVNSCHFVCNALIALGFEAKTVTVVDNNNIDYEVSQYKPTHVFIEALWVVPEKFHVLIPLHPFVKWHVRLHSRIPFLSNEGIAIEWLRRYYSDVQLRYPDQFLVTANNLDIQDTLRESFGIEAGYYPNIYCPPQYERVTTPYNPKTIVDIGCFGAIRPMKNQAYQALAAIVFGNHIGKKIRFHINANRIEQKGDPVIKNIEKSFENTKHELVKHDWVDHKKFIGLVRSMDLGMQVSFSESFNIVAADFVHNDVPMIGSPEIHWLDSWYKANPNRIQHMVATLKTAYYGGFINLYRLNTWGLNRYNKQATKIWVDNLNT